VVLAVAGFGFVFGFFHFQAAIGNLQSLQQDIVDQG
jgi:hypothetical protein